MKLNVVGIALAGMSIGMGVGGVFYRPELWLFGVVILVWNLLMLWWWMCFFKKNDYNSRARHDLERAYENYYRRMH